MSSLVSTRQLFDWLTLVQQQTWRETLRLKAGARQNVSRMLPSGRRFLSIQRWRYLEKGWLCMARSLSSDLYCACQNGCAHGRKPAYRPEGACTAAVVKARGKFVCNGTSMAGVERPTACPEPHDAPGRAASCLFVLTFPDVAHRRLK